MLRSGKDFYELRDLLKAYIVLSEANDYYIRYGRGPGADAQEQEYLLYNKIRAIALSEGD
jgi:hypothetical protein